MGQEPVKDGEATLKGIKRTPREWDAKCRRCAGTGVVHEREAFSLWTPDEYERVQPIDQKHSVPSNAYVCMAVPGGEVMQACREGESISRIIGRPVAFEFNGAVVVIRAGDDPLNIMKDWWLRAFGKSYEDSMKDR